MGKTAVQKNNDYIYNKKLMMRYAAAYAKKNNEKALNEEQVEDILTAIIAIGQAVLSKEPRKIARALIELGRLAKKYGAKLVARFYRNYRERQRRKAKEKGKTTVLPTETRLQKLLAEHELKEGKTQPRENLKSRLIAATKRNNLAVAVNRKVRGKAA